MKFRSSIKPSVLRQTLLKGYFLAGAGILLLILPAIFMRVKTLTFFGPFSVFLSFLLITIGLLPTRRLKKLEIFPHEISFLSDAELLFSLKRKPSFILSLNEIENLTYKDFESLYGIAFFLTKDAVIKLVDPRFDMTRFQINSKKRYGCDLFLPYFSKTSFESLRGEIGEKHDMQDL